MHACIKRYFSTFGGLHFAHSLEGWGDNLRNIRKASLEAIEHIMAESDGRNNLKCDLQLRGDPFIKTRAIQVTHQHDLIHESKREVEVLTMCTKALLDDDHKMLNKAIDNLIKLKVGDTFVDRKIKTPKIIELVNIAVQANDYSMIFAFE